VLQNLGNDPQARHFKRLKPVLDEVDTEG